MTGEGPAVTAGRLRGYHAAGVITWREHEALRLRFVAKLSWGKCGLALGISRESARGRVRSGLRKIAALGLDVAA